MALLLNSTHSLGMMCFSGDPQAYRMHGPTAALLQELQGGADKKR